MCNLKCLALGLLLGAGFAACSGQNHEGAGKPARTLALHHTIRIPARVLDAGTAGTLQQNPGILSLTAGADDELPRGPDGFDVQANGGFVLTDPLQRRLVLYDRLGTYRSAWPTPFPANLIARAANDQLEVGDATSDDFYVFDQAGQFHVASDSVHSLRAAASGEARLLGHNRGVIVKPHALGGAADTLHVNFDSAGAQMISLQNIGVDAQGNTYVAIESSTGGSENVAVEKSIRKYSANGNWLAEIKDISLDYYVQPTEEFRVHEGMVYQLLPQQNEVLINVWDAN